MNGITEFLVVGNTVTMKRGNTIIKEKKAKNKKEAEKIRTEFVNEFWK